MKSFLSSEKQGQLADKYLKIEYFVISYNIGYKILLVLTTNYHTIYLWMN